MLRDPVAVKEDVLDEIDQKDDGYIKLVLRVLARMCDGQHSGLQASSAHFLRTVRRTSCPCSNQRCVRQITGLISV